MLDHKEEVRSGCTHEMVLKRLLNGSLRIDPETAIVFSHYNHRHYPDILVPVPKVLKQRIDRHGAGYQFVEICCDGKKRNIAVHVLQWMQKHKQCVPEGYQVHHKTSPPRPQLKNNAMWNLELKTVAENCSVNGKEEF